VLRWIALALLLAASLSALPAHACPDCAVGKQARAELWNDDFTYNLVVALLPFLVVGLVSYQLNGIGRPDRPRTSRGQKRTLR
jgi:hypothetical protein